MSRRKYSQPIVEIDPSHKAFHYTDVTSGNFDSLFQTTQQSDRRCTLSDIYSEELTVNPREFKARHRPARSLPLPQTNTFSSNSSPSNSPPYRVKLSRQQSRSMDFREEKDLSDHLNSSLSLYHSSNSSVEETMRGSNSTVMLEQPNSRRSSDTDYQGGQEPPPKTKLSRKSAFQQDIHMSHKRHASDGGTRLQLTASNRETFQPAHWFIGVWTHALTHEYILFFNIWPATVVLQLQ